MLNKPYDESVEVSDGEEVTSAQASPREQPTQQVNCLSPNPFSTQCQQFLLHHVYAHPVFIYPAYLCSVFILQP